MTRIYGYNTANFLGPAQVKEQRLDRESQEELVREQIKSQEDIAKKNRIVDMINTGVSIGTFGLNAAGFAGLGNAAKVAKGAQALQAVGLGLDAARLGLDASKLKSGNEQSDRNFDLDLLKAIQNTNNDPGYFQRRNNIPAQVLERNLLEKLGAPPGIPEPMPQVLPDGRVIHPEPIEEELTDRGLARAFEVTNDMLSNYPTMRPEQAMSASKRFMLGETGRLTENEMMGDFQAQSLRSRLGTNPFVGGQVPLESLANLQSYDPGYEQYQSYLTNNKGPRPGEILKILGRNTLGKLLGENASIPDAYGYDNRKAEAQLTLEQLLQILEQYGIEVLQ